MTIENVTLEKLYRAIESIQREIHEIKEVITSHEEEEGELTDWAKAQLEKARLESEENYISHEDLKKEILVK